MLTLALTVLTLWLVFLAGRLRRLWNGFHGQRAGGDLVATNQGQRQPEARALTGLGSDGAPYSRLMTPLEANARSVVASVLAPLRSIPSSPLTMGRFALAGVPSAAHLVRRFSGDEAKALLGGVSAHAMLPLNAPLSAAFGIFLTLSAHAGGWPGWRRARTWTGRR